MNLRSLKIWAALSLVVAAVALRAQTVSPIIVEYKEKGEGKIQLVNDTLTPLVVVLQPQSFTITPDGKAVYRPLDPSIHVELSTTSIRLLPKQEFMVFYKAHADTLPAWFTIYATFSGLQRGPGLNLRIMLPHTVYLYQKQALQKTDLKIGAATFDGVKKIVMCDIENVSKVYGRMREGSVDAGKDSASIEGFPLLPGNPRHLEIAWTGKNTPEFVRLHFDKFDLKLPIVPSGPTGTD